MFILLFLVILSVCVGPVIPQYSSKAIEEALATEVLESRFSRGRRPTCIPQEQSTGMKMCTHFRQFHRIDIVHMNCKATRTIESQAAYQPSLL